LYGDGRWKFCRDASCKLGRKSVNLVTTEETCKIRGNTSKYMNIAPVVYIVYAK
jgi:hypothetical protein